MKNITGQDRELKRISQHLLKLDEDKMKNKQKLVEHEQIEQEFHELKNESKRILGRLLYVWHQDNEMGSLLEQEVDQISTMEARLANQLVEEREGLLHTRRKLHDIEADLSHQQRILRMEDDW